MQTKLFLDYSAYKTWSFCQLQWLEKYRLETRKATEGQQSDTLTLGSLVHEGLRNYRLHNKCVVPEAAIADYNPTPECLAWAQELMLGYLRNYDHENFTKYYCEEALRFDLLEAMDGLAKVDCYFRLDEPRVIASGLGDSFTLEAGWWIHEYKTKAASKNVGHYIQSWSMNMQAAFQLLALQAHLAKQGVDPTEVKGLLVNVLEKPQPYQPKRTCKECRTASELRNWEPTGEGFRCPDCGNIQALDTSDKSKIKRVPKYYRIMVQRTAQQLSQAKAEITQVAQQMLACDSGVTIAERATERCVDQIYGACDYFEPHRAGLAASQWPGFVTVDSIGYVNK